MRTFSNMSNIDLLITLRSYENRLAVLKTDRFQLPHDEKYQQNFLSISNEMIRISELKQAVELEISGDGKDQF